MNWPDSLHSKCTPNMDRIARMGLRFVDFHAGASVCTPSRASLLTGRLGMRTGVWHNFGEAADGGLPTNETTLAEMLLEAGYQTQMIGKWHLGQAEPFHPTYRGFSRYFGLPYSNDMGCTDIPGFDMPIKPRCAGNNAPATITDGDVPDIYRGLSEREFLWEYGMYETEDGEVIPAGLQDNLNDDLAVPLYKGTTKCSGFPSCNDIIVEQPADLTTLSRRYGEEAIDFISSNLGNPFFIYFPTAHMHVPHAFDAYLEGSCGTDVFGTTIAEVDHLIGRVYNATVDMGLSDHTLFIITADNGPWNVKCDLAGSQGPFNGTWQKSPDGGEGGATGKFTTWEGGHREVGVFNWPGKIEPGVSSMLASTLDFFPTFAALAGASIPRDRSYDGVDLSSVLFGNDKNVSRPGGNILFHPDTLTGNITAFRYDNYKLYWTTYGTSPCPYAQNTGGKNKNHNPPLVFDLAKDLAESTPVTLDEQTLKPMVDAWNAKYNDILTTPHTVANYKSNDAKKGCCNINHKACRCVEY